MIQLLTQAADENNEDLGQWSLLTTTIVVRPQQPLNLNSEAIISKEEVQEAFLVYEDNQMTEQEMKIFCQLERLQPQRHAKYNSMRQTALNSSSNSFRCHIWTCQSDQEEERRYIRLQAIVKIKFKAGCADFKGQYEKHFLPMFV